MGKLPFKGIEKGLRNSIKKFERKIIGIDSVKNYNFTFVGAIGVRKSSAINSLSEFFDEDDPQ